MGAQNTKSTIRGKVEPKGLQTVLMLQNKVRTPRKPSGGGIKAALLELNTQLVGQKELLKRLDQEIASLASNPREVEIQKTLDEVRQEFRDYDKLIHELQNMHVSTNISLISLMRRNKATTEELKGDDSDAQATQKRLETLLSKTIAAYMQEGLILSLDKILEDKPALTVTELRQNPLVLTNEMRLNKQAIARVTSSRKKFVPTKMIALSVIIDDYSELRRLRDFSGFKNLELLRYDRSKFFQGLKCLGITDVRLLTNPSWVEFKDTMNDLRKECAKNHKAGERTSVFFHYGGHGLQDNFTFAMCSTVERKMIAFPIEQKVRDLSEVPSTYVVALLDCCREKMTVAEVQQGKKVKVEGRGGGMMEEEPDWSVVKSRDLMVVFGCPPNSYTPADSPLVVGFFNLMNEMSDKVDKVVVLPDNSTGWKPCGKGEVLNLTTHDQVVPFSAEKNPLCLKQSTFMKLNSTVRHVVAMSIVALRRKVVVKEEKIFFNELEGSIVAISPVTKRMKMLQPHGTLEPYKTFSTCQIEGGLFQLSDETCQVLLPDFKTRKFTIEERNPIPHKAKWKEAATVALPGSQVMVIGMKWDKFNLNPWVYDLKENTWSNKLTPNGKTLPPLKEEGSSGSAILLSNKVYFIRGEAVLILDLSTLQEWRSVKLPQYLGNHPLVVPFSSTKWGIVGGYKTGPHNMMHFFDPETEKSQTLDPQTEDIQGVWNVYQQSVVISDEQAFQIAADKHQNRHLIEITLKDESLTYRTIAPLVEAENKAKAVRKYDHNHALELAGLNELTPVQSEAFGKWWSCFSVEFMHDANKDDPLFWIMLIGGEVLQAIQHQVVKRDARLGKILPIPQQEQERFLEHLWIYTSRCFQRDYPEPRAMRDAKLKAIRSLNPNDKNEITWADFKRGYLILATWYDKGRIEHTRWAAELEKK